MFKRIILSVIACVVLTVSMAGAAGNATTAWNELAASYNFETYPGPASATFVDAYYGENFEADFAGIMSDLQVGIMRKIGSSDPDDTFNATLENL